MKTDEARSATASGTAVFPPLLAPKLSLLVLARHDVRGVGRLLDRAKETLADYGGGCEIVVVAAAGAEETVADARAYDVPVVRQDPYGYGRALRAGLAASRGDLVVTLDGDHSHDPSVIRDLLSRSKEAEMVIASRYVRFGHADMPVLRRALSRLGNWASSLVLDVPLTDLTSGFRLYQRRALEQIDFGPGDGALLEIAVRFYMAGFRVAEAPFHYHPTRPRRGARATLALATAFLGAMFRSRRLRNSIASADYDYRAFHSRHPFQRYWQRKRYALVRGFVEPYRSGVDLGCGSSVILDSLPGVIGVDVSQEKLRFLSGHTLRPLVRADIRQLPFPDQAFDLCICSQVIEHLPEDARIFHEFRRLLRPGGVLILGTPDYDKWAWRAIEWLYKRAAPGGYGDEHITRYTRARLSESLAEHGFEVLDHRYICGGELLLKARKTL